MPKKFGINTKSDEARIRKEVVKRQENEKKQKQKEDKEWEDNDPKILAKEKKKKEQEEKRKEQLAKKAENKAIEEKEKQELAKIYAKPKDTKVSRALIEEERQRDREREEAERRKRDNEEQPIEENINHVIRNQMLEHDGEIVDARSVTEALDQFDIESQLDKHPEKRLKAAYLAYESEQLPTLRLENPGLKLSQLKEIIWKQWQKAPENPLNQ